MSDDNPAGRLNRRDVLRTSLAAAAIAVGGALVGCTTRRPGDSPAGTDTAAVSDTNPFGVADDAKIEAVVFSGGFGTDYVALAADAVKKTLPNVTITVTASVDVAQDVSPRFLTGKPPDLLDNSGAKAIGFTTILPQLEDLTPVVEAKNLEGTAIKDTLIDGALAPGTYDGKLVAINYVRTVYGLWYSASLFSENGWSPPKTWEDALDLGARARAKNRYLFLWGKEAATSYLELAISSAIKQGGDEIRLALENLEDRCWSKPAVQKVFKAMERVVSSGYMKPGGSNTPSTTAQAQWGKAQDALFYPSGSWIANEMKDQARSGFKMTGAPVPTVDSSSSLPYKAVHSTVGEPFVIPSQGRSVAGGKEILRVMLSKAAATRFAKAKLAPTVVKDTVPADGFGSTALMSQTKMLAAAGTNVYSWSFAATYGMKPDHLVVWNTFLDGRTDAAALTSSLQEITDRVRNDPSIRKIVVK